MVRNRGEALRQLKAVLKFLDADDAPPDIGARLDEVISRLEGAELDRARPVERSRVSSAAG